MKVLVASTIVPGVRGGGSTIVDTLERALVRRDHEVEVLRIPFHSDPSVMLEQMLALRLLHVEAHGDRLICVRTPAYLLRHPNKVLWFIHHHRPAYDLWDSSLGGMANTVEGRAQRDLIRQADNRGFGEARRIYTNSKIMSRRLLGFNGFESEVLYPPLDEDSSIRPGEYGDAIVYVSRITEHKRQMLAIQAMRHTSTNVRLVIAGESAEPADTSRLERLVHSWGLQDRVQIRGGWIPEADKVDLLADALAVVYCPFDEDSYGYAALEALSACKPVIATTDSGGVNELVEDGRNGFITDPTPEALAAKFDLLFENRDLAARMGAQGPPTIRDLGISWDAVVDGLLA